ncbi:MAG TPA: pyruvate carboxylase [Pirellulaceae bacterium]|nr:pyruvate carboxylase [Pirellulaceae bacterium]
MRPIRRLLVANRGEIAIRVFRTASELGIRTVAIYSHEDRYALHRFKADEAYRIGKTGEPIRAYLDIPGIVALAVEHQVDAIHPGYGFLSENAQFAEACQQAGIIFIGPTPDMLRALGDKTTARTIAAKAGVPVLGGSERPLSDLAEAKQLAERLGYPVMMKAAMGGGGRGMRVVRSAAELPNAFETAQREALSAFGCGDVFLERFVERARHIEVQLLGDTHGNLVHLWERDCSVQRRHQKVVEIAPAPNLDPKVRQGLCDAALKIGRAVGYANAGTVEFLVDADRGEFYFIEVNPRIQVEHTVTEEVTGVDVVKCQIRVAQGAALDDPEIALSEQNEIRTNGFAIQCRVTTEDPTNGFAPDYGRVAHYRSGAGMGIRLDAGSAFSGAVVNPFYDSLLVKVTARGRRFGDAAHRMVRCLHEFRVRGVKTNIAFLIKLLEHPSFLAGECTTRFIDQTPELTDLPKRRDRATRILTYLGETIVNGNALVKGRPLPTRREPAPVPRLAGDRPLPEGSRDVFLRSGVAGLVKWIREQKRLLLTDTTFRDAHQSLLATRLRTKDLLNIAPTYARTASGLFSLEMWGGATFDTSMRFLKECPWDRLAQMREKVPNILFQMLLRGSNAVGYTNYPDAVVRMFVREATSAGMDIFRIFDALNWLPNMTVAMESVIENGGICEAAICYTGDILDPKRSKYDLKYYVNLAKELEARGSHLLAIKDMAGLLKPLAARKLIAALRQEVGIPIHFHTHDTAGIQAASILEGAEQGLEIADAAMAPMSGGTSQPNLNAVVQMFRFSERDTLLPTEPLDRIADYWRAVREFYVPFESVVLPAGGDLYEHEMPGGQYTNLYQQARALGLADRWHEICHLYADVNRLLGDIVKVTPTSKSVGDLALFLVANELRAEDVLDPSRQLSFPESVLDLVGGKMGQPPGGFPPAVVEAIMRGRPVIKGRPGETLPPVDFTKVAVELEETLQRKPSDREVVTRVLYPKVHQEFLQHRAKYSDVSCLETTNFFYGLLPGEEIGVEIEPGKTLIVKFLTVGEPHPDGSRTVFFELNGQPRDVRIVDASLEPQTAARAKADPNDPNHIAAAMPGMVVAVAVQAGDEVSAGQKLLSIEAMKMETTLHADRDARISQVLVAGGSAVETGDLLIVFEK